MLTKVSTSQVLAIRREAEEVLAGGSSAAAFSARFFGPKGRLSGLAGNPRERELLVESDLYRWLQDRLAELRRRDATDFESEVEKASGRLTIMVPKSLHAALKGEARREGVSLSELIRLKLNLPYRDSMVRLANPTPKAAGRKRGAAA